MWKSKDQLLAIYELFFCSLFRLIFFHDDVISLRSVSVARQPEVCRVVPHAVIHLHPRVRQKRRLWEMVSSVTGTSWWDSRLFLVLFFLSALRLPSFQTKNHQFQIHPRLQQSLNIICPGFSPKLLQWWLKDLVWTPRFETFWRNNLGPKILLILYLTRFFTRTSSQGLARNSHDSFQDSVQDSLQDILPRVFQDLIRSYKISKLSPGKDQQKIWLNFFCHLTDEIGTTK